MSARTNTGAGPALRAQAAAPGLSARRQPATRWLGLALTVIRVRGSDLDGTPEPARR